MSLRKRTSNGKYANGLDSPKEGLLNIQQTVARTSSKRKSREFSRSDLRIMIASKPEETQTDEMEELLCSCRTVYRNAIFFSTIIKFLHFTTRILKILVAIYFFLNIFIQGILYSIVTILLRCLFGREPNCYTKVKEVIYPADMILTSPYLEVTLRESGLIAADKMFEISFPVTINNPIIQLVILAILFHSRFLLAYFHNVLRKVARLARDASPEHNFATKHSELPVEL